MKTKIKTTATGLLAAFYLYGCASLEVGRQVQAGRNALQTQRPHDAVTFLASAAEIDANYRIPYRVGEGVLTYLGWAYYEAGKIADAERTLEKALSRDSGDHLARVYLGLSLLRNGAPERGRKEAEIGLKRIHEKLDFLAADGVSGPFWDPAGTLRAEIRTTLTANSDNAMLIAAAERIGRAFDKEIDEARRDEARTRFRGGGGGD